MTQTKNEVIILGGGPAGVMSAYELQQRGIPYRILEQKDGLGATWRDLYPSLRLNTTRFFSHLPGKRFPLRAGIFPSGKEYHQHVIEFAADHHITAQFNTTVTHVSQDAEGWWCVETNQGTYRTSAVIVATGLHSRPIWPNISGLKTFKGTLMHAHDFRDPAQVADQRVLVIGSGPSGVDIAVAAGEVARSASISIRSGITMYRRYPHGLPGHLWLMIALQLPARWCSDFYKRMTKVELPAADEYGLHKPPPGTEAITAYLGPELINAVKAGKVHPVPGPTRVYPAGVEFADGQCIEFDTLICATGYEPALHNYLDVPLQYNQSSWQAPSACEWQIGPNGQRRFPLLDRTQHPNGRQVMGYPGLYVVGVFYKGKGALYNINVEAGIAAEQIEEYLHHKGTKKSEEKLYR